MRLFVALELSAESRRELGRRIAALRGRLPRARWVDPEILHLTLLFLGETDPDKIPALTSQLAQAFDRPSFSVRVDGGGTFPPHRPARVAWVGIEVWEGEPTAITDLQAAVSAAAMEAVGFEPEERAFTPHVTLARCSDSWPRDAAEKFAAAFPGAVGAPFPITRGVLLESKLSPRGPAYREVAAFPLRAAAGEPA